MKKFLIIFFIFSLIFNLSNHYSFRTKAFTIHSKPTVDSPQKSMLHQTVFFTENKGQWDREILFVGETNFGKVAFSKNAIYYQLIKIEENEVDKIKTSPQDFFLKASMNRPISIKSQIIKISFVNPISPIIQGKEILPHFNNYFIGRAPMKWGINCRNFSRITYEDVWEGIDLTYFFTDQGVKYEYLVSPKANIDNLLLKVEGAKISNHDTFLQLVTPIGEIQDSKLNVFEQYTNKSICASFSVKDNQVSFKNIPKTRKNTIVIDPILFSTFLGGSGGDNDYGIAVDSDGSTYITGYSTSIDFPTTPGSYQTTTKGAGDAFVTKLNATGTSLLCSTYLGGTANDLGFRIVHDLIGNIYIGGRTYSTDFPVTTGVYQNTNKGGDADAFVSKLNPTGTTLLYSSYLGGSSYDSIMGIAIDSNGNAYIGGYTRSADFPITMGAYQASNKGLWDAFVTKINSTGNALLYSTYMGGSNFDYIEWGIAVDAGGNAYVAGYTLSADFPITSGAYQTIIKGAGDAFVTKINSTGNALLYSTYIGGSGEDFIQGGIAIDESGNAYITGYSTSTDFPVTTSTDQIKTKGARDAFVSKLNPTGTTLLYSSYLGGSDDDIAQGICLDEQGSIYVVGRTMSSDFPTTNGAYQTTNRGGGGVKDGGDVFVVKLSLISSVIISRISITPSTATLKIDEMQQFTATAFDQENKIVENPSCNWFVQGDIGKISSTGIFTAQKKGSGQIGVSSDGKESFAYVTIIEKDVKNEEPIISITLKLGALQAIVNLNGISKVYSLDVAPFTKNGRTMVPIRFISEVFGAKVEWIPEPTNGIIILYSDIYIQLWVDKKIAKINSTNGSSTSKEIELEVAPFTINSRTVVPLRFIAEAFGAVVNWDSITETIVITLKLK